MTARLRLYACEKCGAVYARRDEPGEHERCETLSINWSMIGIETSLTFVPCGGVFEPTALGDFLTEAARTGR